MKLRIILAEIGGRYACMQAEKEKFANKKDWKGVAYHDGYLDALRDIRTIVNDICEDPDTTEC